MDVLLAVWLAFMTGMWGEFFCLHTKSTFSKIIIALIMIVLFGVITWNVVKH